MRLPRDWTGPELTRRMKVFGYAETRQTGSHVRMTAQQNGEHHITIPRHDPLRVGTLAGILDDVAQHFCLNRQGVLARLVTI